MKKFLELFTTDRYYKMSNEELEKEAAKFKIGGYVDDLGVVREKIISQLIQKDKANDSRFAIFIALISLFASLVALYISIFTGK